MKQKLIKQILSTENYIALFIHLLNRNKNRFDNSDYPENSPYFNKANK